MSVDAVIDFGHIRVAREKPERIQNYNHAAAATHFICLGDDPHDSRCYLALGIANNRTDVHTFSFYKHIFDMLEVEVSSLTEEEWMIIWEALLSE